MVHTNLYLHYSLSLFRLRYFAAGASPGHEPRLRINTSSFKTGSIKMNKTYYNNINIMKNITKHKKNKQKR
jgi:hypothetical protein